MPLFTYRAVDRAGKSATGTMTAENKGSAFDQLAARGLSPIAVEEQGAKANGNGRMSRMLGGAQAASAPDRSSRADGFEKASAAGPPPAATKVSQAALESFTREM